MRIRTRLRGVLARLSPLELTTAAVLVVLLVSGLFGGLRTVDADPVTSLDVGRAVAAAPLEVIVTGTYWSRQFGGIEKSADTAAVYPDKSKRGRFVVVEAKVTNTTDATVNLDVLRYAVSLEGATRFFAPGPSGPLVAAAQAQPYAVYTQPEKAAFTVAQPGVTYRVAYLFEQSLRTAAPTEVSVVVNEHVWREDSLDYRYDWKDPEAQARGLLPLRQQTAS